MQRTDESLKFGFRINRVGHFDLWVKRQLARTFPDRQVFCQAGGQPFLSDLMASSAVEGLRVRSAAWYQRCA